MRFGQVLALRRDILPYRYSSELLILLNEAASVPYAQIRKVFMEEKNISPEEFFLEFDPAPVSSSPLAQVYRARLKGDAEVAVKIQRPEAKKLFEEDFKVLIFLSIVADFFRLFSRIRLREIVLEFISWSKHELDFMVESRNGFIIYKHSEEYPRTIIPVQYLEFSTPRVLVQEFIEGGIFASDFIKGKRNEVDGLKLSYYLVFDLMRQYFVEGFFHADPHPANLIFLPEIQPDGGLAYLDFGVVGKSELRRLPYFKILYGIYQNNAGLVAENLFEFGEALVSGDIKNYFGSAKKEKESFQKISEKTRELIVDDLKKDAQKILEKDGRQIFSEIKKISEKYNIYLSKEIILHLRTLSAANAVGLEISPSFDIIKALGYFFEKYSPEKLEEIIVGGAHEEIQMDIISVDEQETWEAFREIASMEKEKRLAARERFIEMTSYYSEKYGELRSMIKQIK